MDPSILYILVVISRLSTFLTVISTAFAIIFFISLAVVAVNSALEGKSFPYKTFATIAVVPFIFGFLACLCPDRGELAAIYVLPKIQQGTLDVKESELGEKLIKVFNKKLDDYLDGELPEKVVK